MGGHRGFGEPVVEFVVAFIGAIDEGEWATRPLREALPVRRDGLGPIGYLDLQAINVQIPFGVRHY